MVEKTDADQLWRQHNEWEKSEDTQGVSSVETRGMKTEEKNIQELALIGARIPSFTTTKAFSGSSSGCMTLSSHYFGYKKVCSFSCSLVNNELSSLLLPHPPLTLVSQGFRICFPGVSLEVKNKESWGR